MFNAKPLDVGFSATAGFQWSVAATIGTSATTSDTITITQQAGPISIAPGCGKTCKIYYEKGSGNFPYASTVTIHLKGGKTISYKEKGTLKSVQYSSAVAWCVDANNPIDWISTTDKPPNGVNIVS